MNIFNKRPLAVIILISLMSLAGCAFLPSVLMPCFAALFSAAVLVYIIMNRSDRFSRRKIMTAILAALFITVSVLRGHFYFLPKYESDMLGSEDSHEIIAEVLEAKLEETYITGLKVRVKYIDGEKSDVCAYARLSYSVDFKRGDVISFSASVDSADVLMEDGYHTRTVLLSEGYRLCLISEEDNALLLERGKGIRSLLEDVNRRISAEYKYCFGDRAGGFASALALGNQSDVSYQTEKAFKRTGLSHILALSGSHIVLVIGTVSTLLLTVALIPRKMRSLIMLLTVPLYIMLVMSPVPVIRAGVMYMIGCLGVTVGRRVDSITSLFLSVFLMVLAFPNMLFSVSLWMSFLATLALIVFMPLIQRQLNTVKRRTKSRYLFACFSLIFLSIAMCILGSGANLVFSYMTFGMISTVSLPANLIFGPLLTILLAAYTIFIIIMPIPHLASVLSVPIAFLTEKTLDFMEVFSSFKYSTVSLKGSLFAWLTLIFFVAFCLILVLKLKNKRRAVAFIVTFFFIFSSLPLLRTLDKSADVEILPRLKNETVVLRSGDDYSIIDMSDGRLTGLTYSAREAKENGAVEFESVVLTHYHRYHISTLASFFERETVRSLVLPPPLSDSELEIFDRLLMLCEELGVEPLVTNGDKVEIADGIYIHETHREYIKRSTHPVLFLKLDVRGECFAYLGHAISECFDKYEIERMLSDTDRIVIVRHGPIPKKELDFCIPNDAKIYITNDELLPFTETVIKEAEDRGVLYRIYSEGKRIKIK